jgi:hypothetical protein
MLRKIIAWVSIVGGLCATSLWGTALAVHVAKPGGKQCYTFGYAYGEEWLLSVIVYADGFVLVQRFNTNFTTHSGLYCKLSPYDVKHIFGFRTILPHSALPPGAPAYIADAVLVHLAPPLGLFTMGVIVTALVPLVIRRRRRQRGLCLDCGYDLRGNTSQRCPECGRVNAHVLAGRADASPEET